MTNLSLTIDDVKHLATLAGLPINETLVAKLTPQLAEILEFVSQLKQVDTSRVDPTSEITGLKNITQGEDTIPCLTQLGALANASQTQDGFVVVKGVFEKHE